MTVQTTSWQPDTCTCNINYTWDDTTSVATRTHTPSSISNKCQAHTSLATNTDIYNAVLEENQRKNIANQVVIDNAPTTMFDLQADGTTRSLKNSITYSWTWSGTAPSRVLTISYTGITLTTAQKSAIQTKLNTKFGTGRVTLA